MKRIGLINLICSLIAVAVVAVAITFIFVFSGAMKQEKTTLVISSASATSTYDGKPLRAESWRLVEGRLAKGHKLEVAVSGELTDAGTCTNYVTAIVTDTYGNDVSEEYNISYNPGTLKVKRRPITVTAESDMKLYDGQMLIADDYTVSSSVALLPEHDLYVEVSGQIGIVGVEKSEVTSVIITDEQGRDVTSNYNVRKTRGTLTVHPADSIVIESASNQKYYDGEPLSDMSWTPLSGSVSPGHELRVEVTGSITGVGSADNDFNVYVFDAFGKDVTSSYNIVKIMGELVVIKQPTE